MSAKVFFDTTILIYAVAKDDPRAATAEQLLNEGGAVSVQVLNEFASVAKKKLRMSWPEITEALEAIRSLCGPPVAITLEVHEAALHLADQYRYNIYDALILAAALDAGCTVLYSEDMQHDQRIAGLTIRNPFRKT